MFMFFFVFFEATKKITSKLESAVFLAVTLRVNSSVVLSLSKGIHLGSSNIAVAGKGGPRIESMYGSY